MRPLRLLDAYRWPQWEESIGGPGFTGDDDVGAFRISGTPTNRVLRVIACRGEAGEGWDHVSVSLPDRCPSWEEMEYVKRLFFREDETAMQLHVPPADHKNHHPFCLHLWRPIAGEIPRPPVHLVGAP